MTFFTSRWVEAPANAVELPAGGLPQGFRAAGVACSVRPPAIQPGRVSVRLFTTKCSGACSKRARAASASSSALAISRTHWRPGTIAVMAGFREDG